MLNSLDLLVIVFMTMVSLGLLALLLMGLMKNKIVRRISVCVAAALALYTSWVGLVHFGAFIENAALAIPVALASIAAVVLTIVGLKLKNEKLEEIARILASSALIAGIVNIFII